MNISVKKMLLCMVFTASLLFLRLPTYAQTITLTKNEFTLNELFSEIRKQSGFDFVFTTPQFNTAKKVVLKAKKASVNEMLDQAFTGQQISYVIKNKTIVLTDTKVKRTQDFIQGFVGDKKDRKPLPMVTVVIKGTKSAVQTNKDGRFSISIPPGAKSLEFRYMGYKTTEMIIAPNMDYIMYLEEDQQSLQETVITGYGERKTDSYSGAQTKITGEELRRVSATNIMTGIAALDPSFRIVTNNLTGGDINALPDLQIRGANGFPTLPGELRANPNQPLFVLDNFDSGLQAILNLDINLIASVTILKDASATAIYGSRGANGVIVVTTRPPKAGKVQVDFNNTFALTTPDLSVYNMLDARDKLAFEQRAGVYQQSSSAYQYMYDAWYNERFKAMSRGVNTDWLSIPTQTGYENRSSLTLGGGDEIIRYQMNFSGTPQSGVMKGQDRRNLNTQFNLSYRLKKVQFMNQISVGQVNSNGSPYQSFSQYVGMNPYLAPYDANGNTPKLLEEYSFLPGYRFTTTNPLYDASLNSVNKTRTFNVRNNFLVDYTPIPNSRISTSLSLSRESGNTDMFYSAEDSQFIGITDLSRKGSYTATHTNSTNFQSRTNAYVTLNYGRHMITPSLSATIDATSSDGQTVIATGFPFDRLDNLLFAAQYQANSRPSGFEDTQHRLGIAGTLNYTYDNRYIIEGTLNKEGSSAYGDLSRWGTFWSTGLRWNIHNEKFLKDNKIVNNLALRATYGYTGSAGTDAYASQFRYGFGVATTYFGELGATLSNLGNPSLSWQTVRKINIGLNFNLLNNRLNGVIDVYRENTENAITSLTLAPSSGFSSFSENIGKIQNTGVNGILSYIVVKNAKNGLFWSVRANAATNNQILKELSNKLKSTNEILERNNPGQAVPNIQFQEGKSMSTLYVVPSVGIDPATGAEVFIKRNGERTYVWSAADKIAVGDTTPDWNGTLGTSFQYKGFEFGLDCGYEFGAERYNSTLVSRVENVNPTNNVDRRAFDLGWAEPGSVSQYKRIRLNSQATQLTSRFVQRDNQLNITSMSLGYNFSLFNRRLVDRLGLRTLNITAQTNNLANFRTMAMERGTDNPFSRTYNLSLRVGF